MRVKIKDLERQLSTAALKYVSEAEAVYFAQCCLETHLRKAPRMNPLEEAVEELQVWEKLAGNSVETVVDKKEKPERLEREKKRNKRISLSSRAKRDRLLSLRSHEVAVVISKIKISPWRLPRFQRGSPQ